MNNMKSIKKIPLFHFLLTSLLITIIVYIGVFWGSYKGIQWLANMSVLANYTFIVPLLFYKFKYNISIGNKRSLYMPWYYWLLLIEVPVLVYVFPILIYFHPTILQQLLDYSWKYLGITVLNILIVEGVIVNSLVWFGIIYDYLIKEIDHVIATFIVGFGIFFWSWPVIFLKSQLLDGYVGLIYILTSFVIAMFLSVWLSWIYLLSNRKILPVIIAWTLFIFFSYIFFNEQTFIAQVLSTFLFFILGFFIYFYVTLKRIILIRKKHA